MLSAMGLPEDLSKNAALVEMAGQNSVCICNYTGIIDYSQNRLLLQCRDCRLEVTGNNLQILSYTKDELHLSGIIEQTHYI